MGQRTDFNELIVK
jgi:hypothetical protein